MASATASGWPYPVASDPLTQGAYAIHQLANALENKIKVFKVSNVSGGGGVPVTTHVNFPSNFPAGTTPQVFVNPRVASTSVTGCFAYTRDNTGFDLVMVRTRATTAVDVDVVAFG